MSKVFKKWDIWWAKIPYEDDPTQTTIRPALVMTDSYGDSKISILTYKITKNKERQEKELEKNREFGEGNLEEFKIKDVFSTGLPEEVSIIRITKKMRLAQSEFLNDKRAGTLSENDKIRFKNQIKKYKKLIEYKNKHKSPLSNEQVEYLKKRNNLIEEQNENQKESNVNDPKQP